MGWKTTAGKLAAISLFGTGTIYGVVNTREKSPAFKLEYHLLISPGSHKTPNKPRLLSRGKNPKGFVIFQDDAHLKYLIGIPTALATAVSRFFL